MPSSPLSPRDSELERAKRILVGILTDGPLTAAEVEKQASEYGIAFGTLRNAKEALKILSKKERSETGRWVWELPAPKVVKSSNVGKSPPKPPAPTAWVSCLRCGEYYAQEQCKVGTDAASVTIGGHCPLCTEKIRNEREERTRRRVEVTNKEQERISAAYGVGRPHYRDNRDEWQPVETSSPTFLGVWKTP